MAGRKPCFRGDGPTNKGLINHEGIQDIYTSYALSAAASCLHRASSRKESTRRLHGTEALGVDRGLSLGSLPGPQGDGVAEELPPTNFPHFSGFLVKKKKKKPLFMLTAQKNQRDKRETSNDSGNKKESVAGQTNISTERGAPRQPDSKGAQLTVTPHTN